MRGCSFGNDEPCIALRPGLERAIACEDDRVRGEEILNQIGAQAIFDNNEPERAGS